MIDLTQLTASRSTVVAEYEGKTRTPTYDQMVLMDAVDAVLQADQTWWCQTHNLPAAGGVYDRCVKAEWFQWARDGSCRMDSRVVVPVETSR